MKSQETLYLLPTVLPGQAREFALSSPFAGYFFSSSPSFHDRCSA